MKTEQRTVYRCEHCKKSYLTKPGARNHEENCKSNPDNFRACFGCKHLSERIIEHSEFNYDGSDYRSDKKVLFCSKINQPLYPPKVERKKNWFELDPYINQPMKKECDMREDPWD